MTFDRESVLSQLRAEDVAVHYDIRGPWRGRWMRSKRCPTQDHASEAMGISRDGKWHCWSCDTGGDLVNLIALAEGLDVRADFPRLLEVAAGIAGVVADDDFGGGAPPPKPKRPPPPEVPPIAKRLDTARARASWAWERLYRGDRVVPAYLRSRGLDPDAVLAREDLRSTPVNVTREQLAAKNSRDLESFVRMFQTPALAIPVRSPVDGSLVDIRLRRFEPGIRADGTEQPKIVGMLGGVVREGADLLGCYGNPHAISSDVVVVVEGAFDYLTALQLWPQADVLGATDAGSYPLVARHAATVLGASGAGTVVLVAQCDDLTTDDEAWRAKMEPNKRTDGAGDRSVDAATKNVMAILGVRGCAWVECRPYKDLNDRLRAGAPVELLACGEPITEEDFG